MLLVILCLFKRPQSEYDLGSAQDWRWSSNLNKGLWSSTALTLFIFFALPAFFISDTAKVYFASNWWLGSEFREWIWQRRKNALILRVILMQILGVFTLILGVFLRLFSCNCPKQKCISANIYVFCMSAIRQRKCAFNISSLLGRWLL